MQQRQLRLGDILDDYCPRERRVTNHAVVAMIGADVKQTRCTTCDTEHEYKHAKVPRQRRKADTPAALYAQVAANGPKRITHDAANTPPHNGDSSNSRLDGEALEEMISDNGGGADYASADAEPRDEGAEMDDDSADRDGENDENGRNGESGEKGENRENGENGEKGEKGEKEEGPVHRPLIRASLPRPEGQQPPARPIPEFTIRQPGGRPGRFRPRHQRGGQQGQHFHGGNRGNGNFAGGPPRGSRSGGGGSRMGRHHGGPGRKRSK
jgi:hypothetical protein